MFITFDLKIALTLETMVLLFVPFEYTSSVVFGWKFGNLRQQNFLTVLKKNYLLTNHKQIAKFISTTVVGPLFSCWDS